MKTVIIGHFGGYRKMYSFGWTCLIYHATTLFCRRNYNYKNDALGKTVGQMVGAARSARQNIVEASSRAATSKEQELKQLDVAKGSLDELAGDYEAFLVDAGEAPWSRHDPRFAAVRALTLDPFEATDDLDHAYGAYTLRMRARCAARLAARDAAVQAAGAPACPKCGRPMRKMVARKGRNAGNAFWSCTAYPDCTGTRAC